MVHRQEHAAKNLEEIIIVVAPFISFLRFIRDTSHE